MTWRDWVLLVVLCFSVLMVLEAIARAFDLGDEQRHWLDVAASCVMLLGLLTWRKWRGE